MVQKMIQFSKYELFYSAVSILKNNKYWFWGFDHTFVNIPLMTSGTSLNIPPMSLLINFDTFDVV